MITLLKEIDFVKTGILSPLVDDYIHGNDFLKSFYRFPFSLDSFADVMREKSKDETNRGLLVEVLKDQYNSLSPSQPVNENIESLLLPGTFTVTAAHQPCLFMGPLFNIYKIACAVNVTAQLKKAFPANHFVPVFWMGSEDHDTEELNHTYIGSKKIEWTKAGPGAIGRVETNGLQEIIEELKKLPVSTEIIAMLENGLKQFNNFGQFTQYFVHELFKEHGLVIINQDDKRLKESFKGIIRDEIMNSVANSVLKGNLEVLERNYKLQAKPREINFFYLGAGFRERILFNADTQKFEVKDKSLFFTREEMEAEIEQSPEKFSPNVIYRPLFQEYVLPNLAFIGGGGELSYWLELKALFDNYKVKYPMLILRTSIAIVNPAWPKKLEKLNIDCTDLFTEVEQLILNYVKRNLSSDTQLSAEKDKLEELFNTISLKAEAADATLKQNVASEKQKVMSMLENIENKILKAEKRKQETAVNQIRNAHSVLFPDGILQERVENFMPYYNSDFISEIVRLADPFKKAFNVLINN
jgi:bacillithiol synthase